MTCTLTVCELLDSFLIYNWGCKEIAGDGEGPCRDENNGAIRPLSTTV